jgi:hypothetical protein
MKVGASFVVSGYTWEANSASLTAEYKGQKTDLSGFDANDQKTVGDYSIQFLGITVPQSKTEKSEAVLVFKDTNGNIKTKVAIAPGETETIKVGGQSYKVTCGRTIAEAHWALTAAQLTIGSVSGTVFKGEALDIGGMKVSLGDVTTPVGPESVYGGAFRFTNGVTVKASPEIDGEMTIDGKKVQIIVSDSAVPGLTWAEAFARGVAVSIDGKQFKVPVWFKGETYSFDGVKVKMEDVANP